MVTGDTPVKCFMLPIVQRDGMLLRFASDALRDDADMVLAACASPATGEALRHAGAGALTNREVLCAVLSAYGFAIKHVPEGHPMRGVSSFCQSKTKSATGGSTVTI